MKRYHRNLIALSTIMAASLFVLTACTTTSNNYSKAMKDKSTATKTFGLKSPEKFQVDSQGRRINLLTAPNNQTFYFTFDSSSMRPQDLNALNIQANYLVTHPNAKVRLEGNTDDRGSREYNIGLGWRRDQSVVRFLEQQGVKPSQIKALSYGKERPVALGNNERAWSLNRRVDFIYTAY